MKRLVFGSILLGTLAACEPARSPVSFDVSIAATLPTTANSEGWTTEVTALEVSLAAVRFYEGEPLVRRLGRDLLGLFEGTALAHPGHYDPGEALGEWLGHVDADLLHGPFAIGTVDAFTGEIHSGWLQYGPLASGGSFHVAGVARHGEETRPFDVRLTIPSALSGITGTETLTTTPRPAVLRLDLPTMLDVADFSTTVDSDSDGTFEFPENSQAHNALVRGTLDVGAYSFTWVKG